MFNSGYIVILYRQSNKMIFNNKENVIVKLLYSNLIL